jgi:hypothetical protein
MNQYEEECLVSSALLRAVTLKKIGAVEEALKSPGVNVLEASGPDNETALMKAILLESVPIMTLLIDNGENLARVYGFYGMTAYHYAIMAEKWVSLAHIIRRGGYPVTPDGGYSPLELATCMGYWRAVYMLEQERDSPGFWSQKENLVYGEVHKRLGRIRAPKNDSDEMKMMSAKWNADRLEYESFAPTGSLESMNWKSFDTDTKKRTIYCCVSHVQLAMMRKDRIEKIL